MPHTHWASHPCLSYAADPSEAGSHITESEFLGVVDEVTTARQPCLVLGPLEAVALLKAMHGRPTFWLAWATFS